MKRQTIKSLPVVSVLISEIDFDRFKSMSLSMIDGHVWGSYKSPVFGPVSKPIAHFIMAPFPEHRVDFIDGNPLNCTRENLKIVYEG